MNELIKRTGCRKMGSGSNLRAVSSLKIFKYKKTKPKKPCVVLLWVVSVLGVTSGDPLILPNLPLFIPDEERVPKVTKQNV